MKTALKCTAFLAALSGLSEAIHLLKRDNPAVIGAKTHRKPTFRNAIDHDRRRHSALSRRQDDTVSANLDNEVTLYFISVSIGTPATDFMLHIDTGSSDLWVNTPDSQLCQQYSRFCRQTGVYTSGDSSSYNLVASDAFNVTYADGSGATGDYVTDTLTIGDSTLQDLQFGVATASNSPEGILGVGYVSNEGAAQPGDGVSTYANLPQALANSGAINTNAYSLYLDDLQSNTGNILFGGVDSSKYTGDLVTFPIIRTYGTYSEFLIAMTGIGQNGNAGSIINNQHIAVLLDSGTSLTYLPTSVVTAIYTQFNTAYSDQAGSAPVSCSLADETGSLDLSFSEFTVSIPYSELVVDISTSPTSQSCVLGIAPAGNSGISVLGDTFLRNVYVVYDLTNNEISMAQAKYNTGSSNIQEIQTGSTGVPDATEVATPVTSVEAVVTGAIGVVDSSGIPSVSVNGAGSLKVPLWSTGAGLLAVGAAAGAFL